MSFSLVTLDLRGATGCLELDGRCWPLSATAEQLGFELPNTLIELFADWPGSQIRLQNLADRAPDDAPELALETAEEQLLAPLQYPGKVLCAGANYYDHLSEMGVEDTRKEAQRLFFFFKPSWTSVVGPGASVKKPRRTQMFDWEIELAAVIGKTVKDVAEKNAMAAVAAYTVAIDFSARDLNFAPETFYKMDWVAGKAQDTCCPTGPRLVPAEAIADPQDLGLRLAVNGETKQDSRTSQMIFSIAEQIAELSSIMTLLPGDLLLTGTPAGVGFPQKTFLDVGDRVEAEIEGIGTLKVEITE